MVIKEGKGSDQCMTVVIVITTLKGLPIADLHVAMQTGSAAVSSGATALLRDIN